MKYTIIVLFIAIFYGCSDGYPELGDGYRLEGEGGYTTALVNSENTIMISQYVLDYAIDSNFVLVAQSPLDSLPKMNVLIYTDNDRKKIANDKNVFRQYWIISKKQKSQYKYDSIRNAATYTNVYGPFDLGDYKKQRQILNIPEKLQLLSE